MSVGVDQNLSSSQTYDANLIYFSILLVNMGKLRIYRYHGDSLLIMRELAEVVGLAGKVRRARLLMPGTATSAQ